jgi:hypothetical protein
VEPTASEAARVDRGRVSPFSRTGGAIELWPDDESTPLARAWDLAVAGRDQDVKPDTEWQQDPIGWAEMALGIPRETLIWSMNEGYADHEWDGTKDPFVVISDALVAWENVAVESATGTGKSFFVGAVITLWFLACWRNSRVFSFAPKEDQLRLYMWMEIGKLWPNFHNRFPTAEWTDLCIRMRGGLDESWAANGYAVGIRAGQEVAVKAAGMHAKDMLLIGEETPGIEKPVIQAHENTCTAPHNLRLYVGNPDNQQDTLHQLAMSEDFVAVRISALDHPNVVMDDPDFIPGAVSRPTLKRRLRKYGADHPIYQSRARGISPTESATALIKSVWVKACVARYNDRELRRGLPAWGVDVAQSEAGDKYAIARGLGACLLEVPANKIGDRGITDANELGAFVCAEMRATPGGKEEYVGFDAVGVGAGAVNEAKRLGYKKVQALHGGGRAWPTMDEPQDVQAGEKRVTNVERFKDLRTQMYWQFMMDCKACEIGLPDDPELEMDLVAPTWWVHNNIIHLEPKDAPPSVAGGERRGIRQRLGRSTNKGDAAVYWNWVRKRRDEKPPDEDVSAFSPEMLAADRALKYKLGPRLNAKRKRDRLRLREDG